MVSKLANYDEKNVPAESDDGAATKTDEPCKPVYKYKITVTDTNCNVCGELLNTAQPLLCCTIKY